MVANTIETFYIKRHICPCLILTPFCLTCETYGVQESSLPSLCSDWAQRSADWCSPRVEAGRVHSRQIQPVNQKDTIRILTHKQTRLRGQSYMWNCPQAKRTHVQTNITYSHTQCVLPAVCMSPAEREWQMSKAVDLRLRLHAAAGTTGTCRKEKGKQAGF